MTLLTFQKTALQTDRCPESLSLANHGTDLPALDFVAPSTPTVFVAPPTSPVAELTRLLFDRDGSDTDPRGHERWRDLIARKEFRYVPGLSTLERTALSYRRLQLVNRALGSAEGAEGLANDARGLASIHEWTAIVDGSLGSLVSIHYNLFLGSLLDHDPDDRRDLAAYTSMRRTGTFLCTELHHGNDAPALQTVAEYDPVTRGFVLNTPTESAHKFMPNSSSTGGPKSGVVAARLLVEGEDQGVFLFLTPLSDEDGPVPGVTVRRLPERTGNPVDHCVTSFDHVRLPPEALLQGEHGRLADDGRLGSGVGNRRKRFLQSIGRVTTGKLCMSASSIGVSRAALAIAVRYAHHRRITGPRPGQQVALTAHRSHHSRLLHGLASVYAMTFLHRTVTDQWLSHTPENRDEAERMAAIAKAWITWQGRSITLECRERCGAQGLFPVNGLADYQLNIEGAITAEGDNLPVSVKAAAEMLFTHRTERLGTPLVPLDEQPLTELPFLRGLLAEVEGIWQTRARAELRRGPAGDPIGRWNAASSAALDMVAAHARLRATDAFLAAIGRATDPGARFLLTNLCRLFLLEELRHHTGDLLTGGHLSAAHVQELPAAVNTVVADLAPHLMSLVEAFDLPEEFLSAIPIANSNYASRLLDFLN